MNQQNLKPVLAELIGTFTLVFVGAGATAIAAGKDSGGIVAVALAHGIALMVIVFTWGAVSGAHVNPAVTFGAAIAKKIDWTTAVWYWVAQFVGAAIAAYLLKYLLGGKTPAELGATVGTLTGAKGDAVKAVIVEAVLTFFLVATIFSTVFSGRGGNAAGVAIGFVLAMDILVGGSLTGASMNPARTFGPALASGEISSFWIYVVGPLIGGGAAALLWDRLFVTT